MNSLPRPPALLRSRSRSGKNPPAGRRTGRDLCGSDLCRRLSHLAQGQSLDWTQEGREEVRSGNWLEALHCFQQGLLEGQPGSREGEVLCKLLMGQSLSLETAQIVRKSPALHSFYHWRQGDFEQARLALEGIAPPWPWYVCLLASLTLADLGRLEEAQSWLARFPALEGELPRACVAWAEAYGQRHSWPAQARLGFERARRLFADLGHTDGLLVSQTMVLGLQTRAEEAVTERLLSHWRERCGERGLVGWEHRLRVQEPAGALNAGLRIHYFGELTLRGSSGVVGENDWPTRKGAILFVLLSLAQRPLHDESLMEILWPGASQAKARTRFRTTLHHVRLVLQQAAGVEAAEALQRSRKTRTVQLCLPFSSDLEDLQMWVESLRKGEALSLDMVCKELSALKDLRFLPSFRDEWSDALRLQGVQLWSELLMCMLHRFWGQSRYEDVRHLAERALEVDEWREEFHEFGLRALRALGRDWEAESRARQQAQRFLTELEYIPDFLSAYC